MNYLCTANRLVSNVQIDLTLPIIAENQPKFNEIVKNEKKTEEKKNKIRDDKRKRWSENKKCTGFE